MCSFFAVGIIDTSCNNNDTVDPKDTTITSPETVTPDSSLMASGWMARLDTTVTKKAAIAGTGSPTPGVSKPNPARKGMKEKVLVTVPARSTGPMEADITGVYSNVEYIPLPARR